MNPSFTFLRITESLQSAQSDGGFSVNKFNALAKRLSDFVVALAGLIILSPVFILVAGLIKRDSHGPVFYWGPRIGKDGRQFRMLKFRTMYENLDSYNGPCVTVKGDRRITPLGRWLRDTKINELPQLWNVLKGEMSLVGPRPEDPDIASSWPEDLRQTILSIRPGITSPASILYHDEEKRLSSEDVMGDYLRNILPDKMRLDQLYVNNYSFFTDLDVVLWTIIILVPRLAKAGIPEGYLFAGPISRLARRYVSWFLIDLLTCLVAVGAVVLLWRSAGPLNWGVAQMALFAGILAIFFSSLNSLAGFNRIVWSHATAGDALGIYITSLFATLLLVILNYLQTIYQWLPYPPLHAAMIFTIGLWAQIGFLATRYRFRLLTGAANRVLDRRRKAQAVGEKVLIIGAGEGVEVANWLLRRRSLRGAFSIVGIVHTHDPMKVGMTVDGLKVLGMPNNLPDLIAQHNVGMIFCTVASSTPGIDQYLDDLSSTNGVRIVFLDNLMQAVQQNLVQPVRKKS